MIEFVTALNALTWPAAFVLGCGSIAVGLLFFAFYSVHAP